MVVLAFAVRIGFMVAAHTYLFERYRVDEYSYFNETTNIARSIAEGRGFSSPFGAAYTGPTSWIAPVYPYLCALFFALFGVFSTNAAVALLSLQSLISALTCVPILGIAERTVGRRTGFVAALLWAGFPWFSKWAVSWVWEISLSTLLFTCLFWYALRQSEPACGKLWLGFGALWGIALLVNPALLPLLPASLVWCGFQIHRAGGKWVKPALLALAACVLVISPWLVRNRMVFGQWAFLRSNFGFEFWLGNARYATPRGWIGQHPAGNPGELARYRAMGEPAYVRWKLQDALATVRQSPWEFVKLTARRAAYFWDGSAMGVPAGHGSLLAAVEFRRVQFPADACHAGGAPPTAARLAAVFRRPAAVSPALLPDVQPGSLSPRAGAAHAVAAVLRGRGDVFPAP